MFDPKDATWKWERSSFQGLKDTHNQRPVHSLRGLAFSVLISWRLLGDLERSSCLLPLSKCRLLAVAVKMVAAWSTKKNKKAETFFFGGFTTYLKQKGTEAQAAVRLMSASPTKAIPSTRAKYDVTTSSKPRPKTQRARKTNVLYVYCTMYIPLVKENLPTNPKTQKPKDRR